MRAEEWNFTPMINLHETMGPGQDQTHDPWICSQLSHSGYGP